jgi:hypothetical protein
VALVPDKPVLIDLAHRTLIPTNGPEAATHFAHGGWQQIKKLELVLEPVE